ncbi:DUF300-domain-containing protein [Saccharata proteae CBS 121410]|uniref:DUF300-domain-containing protein n=1 Tax=Saccharata proteae CBS 121410 TaxID=1314787 RepID=A0A9P4LVY0_9PEZI|nr:DUF300-domain-containing protein [Saccharata proteae CBS 121410]
MKNSNATCPAPISSIEAHPLSIGITLQHLFLYIGAACTALTLLGTLWLVFRHLRRYTKPDEQRQIIRLVLTPLVYSIFSLITLADYGSADYLEPLPDLYEAFGLACLFVLFVHYMQPPVSVLSENKELMRSWVMVFQYPLIKLILTIAQLASTATGRYCEASANIHFGHIWIVIIGSASLTFCFVSILRFYKEYKLSMAAHKPMLKLVSFKLIVFIEFVRSLVFNFLDIPSGLSDNGTLSPRDIKYGIPSVIVVVEMLLFTIFFHYSFRCQMYKSTDPAMALGAAVVDAANPTDFLKHVARMFSILAGRGRALGSEESRPLQAVSSSDSASPYPSMGASPMPTAYRSDGGRLSRY